MSRRSPDRLKFLRIDHRAIFARRQFKRLCWVLAGIWVVYTFLLGDFSLIRHFVLRSDNATLRAAIIETEAELDSIRTLTENLRDDPETIERVARERYHMVRQDEVAYVFVPIDEREKPRLLEEAARAAEAEAAAGEGETEEADRSIPVRRSRR